MLKSLKFVQSGYNPSRRKKDGQIYLTDSGNEIIDLHLNEIEDSIALEREIKLLPGVVEVGLFNNIANMVIIGRVNSTEIINRV